MSSRRTTPKRYNKSLAELTDQQRAFVVELLADDMFDGAEAAKRAGYKHPKAATSKLLGTQKIQSALGKKQREREQRCDLKADDVWNYLRNALFLNPLHYFKPGPDGGWLITDVDALPEDVGRLIESMEVVHKESQDGSETDIFKVKFVSKTKALEIAMKHCSPNESELKVIHSFDWDRLDQPPQAIEMDDIEQQILEMEQ